MQDLPTGIEIPEFDPGSSVSRRIAIVIVITFSILGCYILGDFIGNLVGAGSNPREEETLLSENLLESAPEATQPSPTADVAIITETPSPSPVPATAPTPPAANYPMPVLSLTYIPMIDANTIDTSETGSLPVSSVSELTNKISNLNQKSIQALANASKFHGYSNVSSQPQLKYKLIEEKTYYEALQPGLSVPWSATAKRPDYKLILNRENICHYVDDLGVKEVWIWGYHTSLIEPVESNMSMGLLTQKYWNHGTYGDASNSENSDDLPVCEHTYVLFNLNYGRELAEVLEDHTHHIEAVMRFLQPTTWKKFVGECGQKDSYSCGWTHYPPNVMEYCSGHDYEWYSKNTVLSDCANWKEDGSGTKTNVSCDTWNPGCKDDGGVGFKVWWMQNIPEGWWTGVGDFDQAAVTLRR